jgi:hypothetical protein
MERVTGVEPTLFRFGRPAPFRLGDTRVSNTSVFKELATVAEVESAGRRFGGDTSATASRPELLLGWVPGLEP